MAVETIIGVLVTKLTPAIADWIVARLKTTPFGNIKMTPEELKKKIDEASLASRKALLKDFSKEAATLQKLREAFDVARKFDEELSALDAFVQLQGLSVTGGKVDLLELADVPKRGVAKRIHEKVSELLNLKKQVDHLSSGDIDDNVRNELAVVLDEMQHSLSEIDRKWQSPVFAAVSSDDVLRKAFDMRGDIESLARDVRTLGILLSTRVKAYQESVDQAVKASQ